MKNDIAKHGNVQELLKELLKNQVKPNI